MLLASLSVLAAASAAVGLHFSPHVLRRLATARLRRQCCEKRILALTYDDGPGPRLTPQILDLLREHNVQATFFLLGRRIPGAEAIVDRVAAEGHEIGCHSMEHLNAWKVTPGRAVRDVEQGYQAIARWAPANTCFRPPNGKIVLSTWLAVRRRRAPLGWWTVDSGDTFDALPSPDSVLQQVKANSGGVVLMHDFDRSADSFAQRSAFVIEVTRKLLGLAEETGLQVKPVSALTL